MAAVRCANETEHDIAGGRARSGLDVQSLGGGAERRVGEGCGEGAGAVYDVEGGWGRGGAM